MTYVMGNFGKRGGMNPKLPISKTNFPNFCLTCGAKNPKTIISKKDTKKNHLDTGEDLLIVCQECAKKLKNGWL